MTNSISSLRMQAGAIEIAMGSVVVRVIGRVDADVLKTVVEIISRVGCMASAKRRAVEQPAAAMLRRGCLGGPGEDAGGPDITIAAALGERHEASELDRLTAELEAQRAPAVDVSFKISAQHHTPPGQDCAIWRSIVTSTLA